MYEKTAKESLLAAVNNLKKDGNVSIDENLDTDIGIDGSWQKKSQIIKCSRSLVKAAFYGKIKKGLRNILSRK